MEAERHVERDAGQEAQADVDPGVLEGVDPLEVGGLVDGDVPVDCHAYDDVHTARHEGVYQGQLQMGLGDRTQTCWVKFEI